jgi:hypothetical protein
MKKLLLPLFALFFSATMFAQTAGTLTFKVTTVSAGGLSGSHDQAIWITNNTTNSAAAFVKTLLGYNNAGGDKSHLAKWLVAAGSTPNVVDAVTQATQSAYGQITGTWNGTNISRTLVVDGNYTIWCEVTDNGTEVSSSWTFAKGATAVNTTGTATTNLTNVSIVWTPVSTAINDVEMEKLYTLYPSPAVSSIYVSGLDIESIEICSLSAKILMHTNEQNVNISQLPKGAYLAVVYTKSGGLVVKKFQKM